MRSVTAFFGEDWEEADPARVLRVVRDFVSLFDKCMGEIEVRAPVQATCSWVAPGCMRSLLQMWHACNLCKCGDEHTLS